MEYETEKADAKRQDLKGIIAESLRRSGIDDSDLLAGQVVQQFADVTAPYYEPEPMKLIVLGEGGVGGGSTTKPGNVVLNLRKLVRAIASGILTIAGATAAPWLLVIGALVTWDALWSCLNLKLTEEHACVIWALWENRDDNNTFPKSETLDAVNRERAEFGMQPLSAMQVNRALDDLVKMGCVKQSANDPQRWWLREWIRIKYR
jgi:hypothetical protein